MTQLRVCAQSPMYSRWTQALCVAEKDLQVQIPSLPPECWDSYVQCMLTSDPGFLHARQASYQLSYNPIVHRSLLAGDVSSSAIVLLFIGHWAPFLLPHLHTTVTRALYSSGHHGLCFDFGTRCHCSKHLGTSSALLVELSLALEAKLETPTFMNFPSVFFLFWGWNQGFL